MPAFSFAREQSRDPVPAHRRRAGLRLFHPAAQLRTKLRDLCARDVDPAVGTCEDHLGILERVDAARLAEESGVLLEESEVCTHFAPGEEIRPDDDVRDTKSVPERRDEVQGAGDVGNGLLVFCGHLLLPLYSLRRLCQPRKRPPSPLFRLGQDGYHLSRDATCKRHGAGQSEDDNGCELATDEEYEGEKRYATDIVGPAAPEDEAGTGRAPVLGDALHGGSGDDGGGRRVGCDTAGGVEGPDEASIEVNILQARLVKGEVGFPCVEEVRDRARLGGACGEFERGRAGGRWWVRGGW